MYTFRYFLFLSLAVVIHLCPNQSEAQNDTIPSADTLVLKEITPFFRVGFDLSAVFRNITEPEVQQYEISAETGFIPHWFAVFETGFLNVSSEQEQFAYRANGFFLRFGGDYNLLQRIPDPEQNNLVLFGIRYGMGFLQHEAPYFFIEDPYWGNFEANVERNNFQMHWLEMGAGVKTEIINNLFLGWGVRWRIRLFSSQNPALEPYYIPGFGNGSRNNPVSVYYSIMYRFKL